MSYLVDRNMNETLAKLKTGEALVLTDDGDVFEFVERTHDGYAHIFNNGHFAEIREYDEKFQRLQRAC